MSYHANYAVTRQQMRELDRIAIEEYEIPGLILMENAGRACAQAALEMLDGTDEPRAVVLCGRGNNGGDGFVVARHLLNREAQVTALLLGAVADVLEDGGEAAVNLKIVRNMGIEPVELSSADEARAALGEGSGAHLLVDALLGTGISGEVRQPFRGAIRAVNQAGMPVLAVDVPSGLDCDTGLPLGVAVRAKRTVTFGLLKRGLVRPEARPYTGELEVAQISIPRALITRKIQEWEAEGI